MRENNVNHLLLRLANLFAFTHNGGIQKPRLIIL